MLLFCFGNTFAQLKSDFTLVRWNKSNSFPIYAKLNMENAPLEKGVPEYLSKAYKFSESTSVKSYRVFEDKIGFKHIRYQVYVNDVPVDGSVIIAHVYEGRLHSFNGEYYGEIIPQVSALGNEKGCLDAALGYMGAQKYLWEIEDHTSAVGMGGEAAAHLPKGELMYAESKNSLKAENFVLAYRFNIYSYVPHSRKYVYVAVANKEILKDEDLIHTGDIKGKAKTRYSDTVDIYFDSLAPNSYRLRQTTLGKGIETFDMNNGTSYGAAVDFVNTISFWDSANAQQNEVATDAHWGAEKTYEYFLVKHNRRSFDDQDAKIRSFVHRGVKYNNAFWNGSVMTYGDGDSTRFYPLTCIDVCGHEVSHAVTTYTAGLVYRYESGALNESFSDIFGNAIERYARPNKYSYKIGEDITPSGRGIRDMSRPNANNHPDTYKGFRWRTGTGDNGGVHSNSGVQNHWYYVLSEGDTSTNDNSDAFSVAGIGYEKAAEIAYRNLSVYLTKNSQYADARYYGIRAAVDLFGDCSSEMIETTNAWYAVGVGPEYKDSVEVAFNAQDTLLCFETDTVFFNNLSINSSTYKWDFGDGNTSIVRNPKHVYNAYGYFTVKLVAGNCNNTKFDSVTLTNYIHIDSSRLVCKSDLMPEFGIGADITKCDGYLMDNGGENDYLTLRTTVRTIAPYNATKVHAKFLQFRMENRYDSLYVYDGTTINDPLLGAYTGYLLPPDLVANSGAMTFKHFADPLAVDSGFIVQFYAEKNPLKIIVPEDDTVCINQEVVLVASASGGGDTSEFEYYWTLKDTLADTLRFTAIKDTVIRVYVYDNCMLNYDTGYVNIKVNPELKLSLTRDTILCFGNLVDLTATGEGGDSANYLFAWDKGLGTGNVKTVTGFPDTLFTLVLSDGCSLLNDTALVKVTRLDSFELELTRDTLLCEGNSLELIANATGGNGNYTYSWDNGLGLGDSKNISPLLSTTYNVIVSDGCTNPSLTDSIMVIVADSLKIDLEKDSTICIGQNLDINALVSGGKAMDYLLTWSNAVGNVLNANVAPVVTTKYTVTISDGCSVFEPLDSVVITVRDSLKVTHYGDTTICTDNNISLLALANGGNSSSYLYTWNNGLGNGDLKNISPAIDTKYEVVLSDGCTNYSDTTRLAVFVREPLSLLKSKDTSICIGENIDLEVTANGGKLAEHIITWNQGLGVGTKFNVSPADTTSYVITLEDGCSIPFIDSIRVNVILNPVVDFEGDKTILCTGDSVQFTNLTQGIVGTVFNWNSGAGNDTIENPRFTYNTAGSFPVTLTIKNNAGCEGTATKVGYIEVLSSPIAGFTYLPKEPNFAMPVVVFNNTSKNANTYFWDFGNGQTRSNAGPRMDYGDTGTFLVTLTATNSIGCTSTYSEFVTIKDVFRFYVPTAFTPNQDALNEFFAPKGRGIVHSDMTIMNTWGEVIFKSSSLEPFWNGAINNKGDIVQMGAYIYMIRVLDVNNVYHTFTGNIDIIN